MNRDFLQIKAQGYLMYLNDCTKYARNTQENSRIMPLDEQTGLSIQMIHLKRVSHTGNCMRLNAFT